jgi:pantetheine-phosphate adenylyltransferase
LRVALYPGSFDPITKGHVDIAARAAALFDQLVIGVFDTPSKDLMFSTEERVQLVKEAVGHLPNVTVEPYNCLTVEFLKEIGAKFIVRGLRMGSDFEREFDMALMNQKLDPEIDTVCLMSNAEYQFISSSLLKEVAEWGEKASVFVPECVADALERKLLPKNRRS